MSVTKQVLFYCLNMIAIFKILRNGFVKLTGKYNLILRLAQKEKITLRIG